MALSPNYGFPEPDNSSLVKNGAQDIRALGDAIDNLLFRPFSRNGLLNGAMDIWQRGTTFTTATVFSQYTADRWFAVRGATTGSTWTRQLTNDTTNLPNIQYCIRAARNSGNASTTALSLSQSMENSASTPFIGKQVTMSFYARAGANYSAASGGLVAQLKSGTGTDQSVVGFTGSVNVINQTATLTTTWQRFSYTGTVGVTATQLAPVFIFIPTGTAGANDYFEITGLQLEIGNQASPFSRASTTGLAGELAACQRYYYRNNALTSTGDLAQGQCTSTTNVNALMTIPTQMRVAAISIDYPAMSNFVISDGTSIASPSSITLSQATNGNVSLSVAYGSFTVGRIGRLYANGTTSAYIGVNCEL